MCSYEIKIVCFSDLFNHSIQKRIQFVKKMLTSKIYFLHVLFCKFQVIRNINAYTGNIVVIIIQYIQLLTNSKSSIHVK